MAKLGNELTMKSSAHLECGIIYSKLRMRVAASLIKTKP